MIGIWLGYAAAGCLQNIFFLKCVIHYQGRS